jgi:adenosine deaminase
MPRSTIAAILLLTATLHAQTPAELRTDHALDAARKLGSSALYAFLKPMPKGADLHLHLSGAIYAETFIRDAAADGLCFNTATLTLVPPAKSACPGQSLPAAAALTGNQHLYDQMVNAFSVRSFVPTDGRTAHDEFFDTFDRFGALGDRHHPEWIDEILTRAAANNNQYVEIMDLPNIPGIFTLAKHLTWPNPAPTTPEQLHATFDQMRATLLANGSADQVTIARQAIHNQETATRALEHCSTPQATPACNVADRYIIGVLRDFTPELLFAQFNQAFALAAQDPAEVVSINPLRAEDWFGSRERYTLGLQMIDYFHTLYPSILLTLHAGELSPGLVPPEDLTNHIRQAVELGHASRIGHGIDVLFETDPNQLLHEMAEKHIMVEINLTSNDQLNNISGKAHPLAAYRAAQVPVALSTDDEGVSRSDLTHEYVRSVLEQNLTYPDLKQMARTSLEHAFLPGPSLWAAPDNFTKIATPCATSKPDHPTPTCAAFLKSSPKATQQYDLEHRFAQFESKVQ